MLKRQPAEIQSRARKQLTAIANRANAQSQTPTPVPSKSQPETISAKAASNAWFAGERKSVSDVVIAGRHYRK